MTVLDDHAGQLIAVSWGLSWDTDGRAVSVRAECSACGQTFESNDVRHAQDLADAHLRAFNYNTQPSVQIAPGATVRMAE